MRLLARLPALPAADGRAPALVVASVAVAAALAVAVAEYPEALRALNNRAAHNSAIGADGRNLEIASVVAINTAFVRAALELPRDATYVVATGPDVRAQTPLAAQALTGYLENLLLPRRRVPAGAEWLLCYDCELPAKAEVRWREDGLAVARLVP